MEWYEKISIKIVDFVEKQLPGTTSDERDRIKYGIEALLVNLYSLPILFLSAYLLGVFHLFIAVFLSFGLIRTFAGGFHAKTSSSCLILTIISYAMMIILSRWVYINVLYKVVLLIISFTIFIKYAPADNEEKPIVNRKHRKVLKYLTCIVAGIYIIIAIQKPSIFLGNVLFYALLFESIFVSPLLYKIFNRRWKNYEYLNDYIGKSS